MKKKTVKEHLVGKHETRQDLVKDVIACAIVVYVATLAFLLVDSRVKLVNAQTDYISSQIQVTANHASAELVD